MGDALRAYLHSGAHLDVWIPLIKPRLEQIVVFDNALPITMGGIDGSFVYSQLLQLPPQSQEFDGAESAAKAVTRWPSELSGLTFALFEPYGGGGLGKAEL